MEQRDPTRPCPVPYCQHPEADHFDDGCWDLWGCIRCRCGRQYRWNKPQLFAGTARRPAA